MTTFAHSRTAYEAWLKAQLGADLVAKDLRKKDEVIRESAFAFLRGTYWRWAETVPALCPDLMTAPATLAVGDIHLENFGTWRDAEGRLVWGVNDFDEAAVMPYTLDLVRLAASALLVAETREASAGISAAIVAGYAEGLKRPRPIVLEREWAWLRDLVVVPDEKRAKFWKKLDALKREEAPARFRAALSAAMPAPGLEFETARRVAGNGSLGRARWAGIATWRGGPVVREAKALVTSAWVLARGESSAPIRCGEIANGIHRAPDPWYRVADAIVVRRLSPNNVKLDVERNADALLSADVHGAMGLELASIHLGCGIVEAAAIHADFAARKPGWLAIEAGKAAAVVETEWRHLVR